MSVRGTVCQGNVFGELSAREKSLGEKSVGELSGYRPCKSEWENENFSNRTKDVTNKVVP